MSDLDFTLKNIAAAPYKEVERTDTKEVKIIERPYPHSTKLPQSLFPNLYSLFEDIDLLHVVLLTSEESQASEFIEGSSKDVEKLSQQLQQSTSFTEDSDNIWLRDSTNDTALFEF